MLDTVETDEMLVIPWKWAQCMTSRCCARKFNFWQFQQVEKDNEKTTTDGAFPLFK